MTGGDTGIGRAVVHAFLAEGASVCVLEYSEAKCAELETIGGGRLAVVQGDATRAADNERAVAAAIDRFERLDTLATFVGIFDHYTHLVDIPPARLDDAFAEVFEVNVKSVMLAAHGATPHLRRVRGSIVVTASSSSFYPGRGGALYVASKFALRGLVVELAHALAPDIRVNGVAPEPSEPICAASAVSASSTNASTTGPAAKMRSATARRSRSRCARKIMRARTSTWRPTDAAASQEKSSARTAGWACDDHPRRRASPA